MCLVIAVVLAIFAFNAMMAGNTPVGLMALAGSLFFIVLMIRNIQHVRRLRDKRDERPTDDDKIETQGQDI